MMRLKISRFFQIDLTCLFISQTKDMKVISWIANKPPFEECNVEDGRIQVYLDRKKATVII